MLRKLSKVCLLIIGIAVTTNTFASDSSTGDFSNVENEWYAETFKVSIDEAEKRQKIAEAAGEIADIFDVEADKFAGMVIQHEPKFRVIYNVKKNNCKGWKRGWGGHQRKYQKYCKNDLKKRLNKELRHKPWRRFAKIKTVNFSLSDLNKLHENALELASEHIKDGYGTLVDTRKNRVEITTLNKKAFIDELFINRLRLPKGIYVREIAKFPSRSVWGGGILDGSDSCTSGFVVVDSRGRLGVSTADHCGEALLWNGFTSPFVGEALTRGGRIESRDVAWHRLPENIENQARNRIRIGIFNGLPAFRNITGIATTRSGETVCSYGRTTFLQCGIVVNVNVGTFFIDDDDKPLPPVAGLIQVTRNGQPDGGGLIDGGDSGGPLFKGNNALGSTVGGFFTEEGDEGDSYYATVGSITAMGVTILTQ